MAFMTKLPGGIIMAVGQATQDGEYKTVGEKQTPLAKFSIACGKKDDGSTRFANCQAWGRNAALAGSIVKGETVMCFGTVESREYEGKVYNTLTCDYVGLMRVPSAGFSEPKAAPETFAAAVDEDEGELPF